MNSTYRPALTLALLLSLPAASHASELALPETREHLTEPRHFKVAKVTPTSQPPDDTAPAATSEQPEPSSQNLAERPPSPIQNISYGDATRGQSQSTGLTKLKTQNFPQPVQPSDLPRQRNATDLNNSEFGTLKSELKTPSSPSPSSSPPSPLAQTEETVANPTSHRLPPRVGVGYTGAGYEGSDSFGRLEGFIPLRQNPGRDVTFLEGRVLLDNDANLGSNVLLGHRAYNQSDNRIYGGYIGYDTRDTGHKFFQQLGLGFESLGEVWDVRANVYLPLGDRRQQVDVVDTGLVLTDTRFNGHFLLFDLFRERNVRFESAATSFDLEAGGRIAKLRDRGEIRLYGGPYYYSAPGSPEVLGWRTRAEIRPNQHVNFGLGFQTDGLFGTNLLFSVGATFPSGRAKVSEDPEQRRRETVLARLGDFIQRNPIIVVDSQLEVAREQRTTEAINPATGEPWFFNHVTLGLSGGDGTFENPFGTVQNGLNNTRSDGNDIVYVAQGSNPGIPSFTIPDKVQVLSRGPIQTIPVQVLLSQLSPGVSLDFGSVVLPFSNSGNFPTITGVQPLGGAVVMGNDSVLSGFTINPTAGNAGVLVRNVSNVEIRDNRINATGDDGAGVRLQNVGGTATITNNQIDTTGNTTNTTRDSTSFLVGGSHGIEIDLEDTTLTQAAISGNTITTAGTYAVGILAQVRSQTGAARLSSATISSNTISTVGDGADGIQIAAPIRGSFSNATITGGSIGDVTLLNNMVSTQGQSAEGIEVALPISLSFAPTTTNSTLRSGDIDSVTISGNTVFTQGLFAIGIAISQPGGGTTSNTTRTGANIDRIAIADNTVSTQGRFAEGIVLQARNDRRIGNTTISGNTVSAQGDSAEGISVDSEDNSRIDSATISGNLASTQGEFANAIYLGADDDSRIESVTLSGNTLSTGGDSAEGIEVRVQDSSNLGSATISGNTVSTARQDAHGIYIRAEDPNGVGSATISGNTISTAGEDAYGIYIRAQDVNSVGSATISGNTISTQGQEAYGIYIRAQDVNSVGSATISDNTVSTAGNTAHGVRLRTSAAGASACFSVSGNTVTTQQATANPFNFQQVAGSTFKILDTDGTTLPQTMANNTAIANGGAILFQLAGTPFTIGTSCP